MSATEPASNLELTKVPPAGDDAELAVLVNRPASDAAPTILYLHGFGSYQEGEKGAFFRDGALAAGLGFVSVDFQGHGRSGGEMRGLTLERCLRDVERTRAAVPGLERPVAIVGSSLGALVGLWHAAEHPGTVAALALIAPAIGLDAKMAELLGPEGMAEWRRDGVLEVTNELGTFELGWEFARDLERYPTAALVARHATPALIFQGGQDDRVSWQEVAAFAEATGGTTRLELIEAGDHRLIEHMDRIRRQALAFVADATPNEARA